MSIRVETTDFSYMETANSPVNVINLSCMLTVVMKIYRSTHFPCSLIPLPSA